MSDLKTAWQVFDKNGTGKITQDEIGLVMRAVGYTPSEKEVEEYGKSIVDADGTVSWDNFQRLLNTFKIEGDAEAKRHLEEALRVYDKDNNKLISLSDLKSAFTTLGEPLTYDEMDDLLQHVKVDAQGKVYIPDFIDFLLKTK